MIPSKVPTFLRNFVSWTVSEESGLGWVDSDTVLDYECVVRGKWMKRKERWTNLVGPGGRTTLEGLTSGKTGVGLRTVRVVDIWNRKRRGRSSD